MARCIFGTAGETASFCLMTGVDNLGATLTSGTPFMRRSVPPSLRRCWPAPSGFAVHLNDNDGRWDWDMAPGAFHLWSSSSCSTPCAAALRERLVRFRCVPKEIDTVENFTAVMQT